MADITKFSGKLRSQPDYLAFEQTVPANTNADGNRGARLLGKVQGAIEIGIEAATDVTIPIGATLTLKALTSGTEDGNYTEIGSAAFESISAATVFLAGTHIVTFAIPSEGTFEADDNKYVKVNFATDSASSTGKLNAFQTYQGR